MTIKTISNFEWTDLSLTSGKVYAIQAVSGFAFKFSTESTPSSTDDGITIKDGKVLKIKAGSNNKAIPEFSSYLPFDISVQEVSDIGIY